MSCAAGGDFVAWHRTSAVRGTGPPPLRLGLRRGTTLAPSPGAMGRPIRPATRHVFPTMTIQRFESGPAHEPGRHLRRHGLPRGPGGRHRVGAGVTAQTQEILGEIDRLLAAAGTDKSRILTATIYLADIATFAEMNAAWDAWVAKDNPPARATVEAKLAAPEYLVEIVVVAAKGRRKDRHDPSRHPPRAPVAGLIAGALAALALGLPGAGAGAAPRASASSTSTTGRTTSTPRCWRPSPRRPASRSSTTPTTTTRSSRPSCSPAGRATTSSCPRGRSCSG